MEEDDTENELGSNISNRHDEEYNNENRNHEAKGLYC
jgi:hypothetical protein